MRSSPTLTVISLADVADQLEVLWPLAVLAPLNPAPDRRRAFPYMRDCAKGGSNG